MNDVAIPETPGSGINAPHENDDDPAAFFGDDPDAAEEPSLMPEDDPDGGEPAVDDTEPDTEPEMDPDEGEPGESEKQQPPKPASGEATAGQAFSEDGETIGEVGGASERAAADEPDPTTARTAGDAAAPSAGEPAPPRPPAAASAKTPSASEPAAPPKNGPRGYVVIREIALTTEYLEHFAKQLEEGKDPHKVYLVLEPKVEARNPAPVLTGAFKKHYKRLGQPLRLAAIPLSMWNLRSLSIKPKIIDENIAIED